MKDRTQREYYKKNKTSLLVDYVTLEMERKVMLSLIKACRLLPVKSEESQGHSGWVDRVWALSSRVHIVILHALIV